MKRERFVSAVAGLGVAISLSDATLAAPTPKPATPGTFKFNFQGLYIYSTRSPNSDTNYAALTVRVGIKHTQAKKYIGDNKKGNVAIDLNVTVDVPNDAAVPVVVAWTVINDDEGSGKALDLVGNIGLGVVGVALTYVPVVGAILATIYGALVNPFRSHNGPVVVQQYVTDGAALNRIPIGKGGGPLNGTAEAHGAKDAGRDLPGKEGSDYESYAWVSRVA